jgi:hypothetical protein
MKNKGFYGFFLVTDWPMIIKKKTWWTYPQGGGEPHKFVCYALCLDLLFLSLLLLSELIYLDGYIYALCLLDRYT